MVGMLNNAERLGMRMCCWHQWQGEGWLQWTMEKKVDSSEGEDSPEMD